MVRAALRVVVRADGIPDTLAPAELSATPHEMELLAPGDFTGGEAIGHAQRDLSRYGFSCAEWSCLPSGPWAVNAQARSMTTDSDSELRGGRRSRRSEGCDQVSVERRPSDRMG